MNGRLITEAKNLSYQSTKNVVPLDKVHSTQTSLAKHLNFKLATEQNLRS